MRRHMQMPAHHEVRVGMEFHEAPIGGRVEKWVDGTDDRRCAIRCEGEFGAEEHFSVRLDGAGEALVAFRLGRMRVGEENVEYDRAGALGSETIDQPCMHCPVPGSVVRLAQLNV